MGLILAALFIGVPAVEIALLVKVGGVIGAGWTFLLVIATGALGAAIARHQGTAALRGIQEAMASGRAIGAALGSAALVLVGAVLLVTPGFVTDAVGLILLIPWIRPAIARALGGILAARGRTVVVGFDGFDGSSSQQGGGGGAEADYDPPPPGVIDV